MKPRRQVSSLSFHPTTGILFALVLIVAACGAAGAQMADPAAAYRKLLESRMSRSQRAVEETQRRRFEEGKTGTQFPSDAQKKQAGAKPGVLRAGSPEEQRALEHNERGLNLFAKGKAEQALKEYNAAVRIYPNLAAAHNNMGSALFALARFEESAAAFRRAIEIDSKYGQAHFNLALAYIKLNREKEANDALTAATHAFITVGDEHYASGRLAEAEESFKALLQIDPNYYPAFLRLGIVYNAARRYTEAVEMLTRLVALRPDSADAHENLGEALHGQGKYAEAAQAAERAIRLDPAAPGAHYIAGISYASLGDRERALAARARLADLKAERYAERLAEYIEQKAPARK
jgi:tetratricopeptide (TPR) repeat protein